MVSCWNSLHFREAPEAEVRVIRVQREAARDTKRDPRESWFLWTGTTDIPLEQVRTWYRKRSSQAIEVASADLVQLRRRDQVRGGLHALLDGADAAASGGQHHFRRHIRRRMQAVGRDTSPREFLGQIKREHDERQFALAIRLDSIIAAREHDVTKVNGSLSG